MYTHKQNQGGGGGGKRHMPQVPPAPSSMLWGSRVMISPHCLKAVLTIATRGSPWYYENEITNLDLRCTFGVPELVRALSTFVQLCHRCEESQ